MLQDALTLQRVCLSKKAELVDDSDDALPDVPALVQELMLNVFVSTFSHAVNVVSSLSFLSPIISTWPHLRRWMLVWRKANINKNCLCVTVLWTIIMVHYDVSSSYRSVDCIGL